MLKPQLHHMTTSSQPQATPSSQPQAQHPRDKIHFVPSIFPEIQYGLRFKPQLTGLAAVTHAVTFIQWSKLTITEEEYRNFWQDYHNPNEIDYILFVLYPLEDIEWVEGIDDFDIPHPSAMGDDDDIFVAMDVEMKDAWEA